MEKKDEAMETACNKVVDLVREARRTRRSFHKKIEIQFIADQLWLLGFKKDENYIRQQEAMCEIVRLLKAPKEPSALEVFRENEPYVRFPQRQGELVGV